MALANAMLGFLATHLPLRQAVESNLLAGMAILDCNGAEGVSAALSGLPGYLRADYPACDMQRLPFEDNRFDLVIHSDTLEHVQQPLLALEECRRVLKTGGRLCFTIPIIVGRFSRRRDGLAQSYHGDRETATNDLLVHTEFGVDAWTFVHRSGFTSVALHQIEYPTAIALSAWDDLEASNGPAQF